MSEPPIETTIAPWLAVSDGDRAVEYYRTALGAVDVYRHEGDDRKVVVARLLVGGAAFWVRDDPGSSPEQAGNGSVRMILTVSDPDALFVRPLPPAPPRWRRSTRNMVGAPAA